MEDDQKFTVTLPAKDANEADDEGDNQEWTEDDAWKQLRNWLKNEEKKKQAKEEE